MSMTQYISTVEWEIPQCVTNPMRKSNNPHDVLKSLTTGG